MARRPAIRVARPAHEWIVLIVALGVAALLGRRAGAGDPNIARNLAAAMVGTVVVAVIWRTPYLGLVAVAASLPVQAALPQIPLASSAISALGVLSLAAFAFHRAQNRLFTHGAPRVLGLAGAFFIWQVATHPAASLAGDRNWTLTFAQLLGLMWLASELLTPERLRRLMWVYVATSALSGFVAYQGSKFGLRLGVDAVPILRGTGLAGEGAQNPLGQYLAVAVIFAIYLHQSSRFRSRHVVFGGAYAALLAGLAGTASRASLLALLLGLVLVVTLWSGAGHGRRGGLAIASTAIVVAALLVVPEEYFQFVQATVFSDQLTNYFNYGNRMVLIGAAWRMWLAFPLAGAGIGRFGFASGPFLSSTRLSGLAAHNLYFGILAETGAIGFLLFMGWIVGAARTLGRVALRAGGDLGHLGLAWFTAFVMLLARGFAASDMHYEKLLWMMGGVAIALGAEARRAAAGEPDGS